jgi:hypothetical protein
LIDAVDKAAGITKRHLLTLLLLLLLVLLSR